MRAALSASLLCSLTSTLAFHVPWPARGSLRSAVGTLPAASLTAAPAVLANSSAPTSVDLVPSNSSVSTASKTSRKAKPVRLTPKQATGLNYSDAYGEHDVPIVETPLWYRLNVRKASEKRVCESLLALGEEPRWREVVVDAYYPQTAYVRFKAKSLVVATKPLIPGLVYVKSKMNPDIADDLERLQGIYGFTKTLNSFVQPLSEEQAVQLESMKGKVGFELSPEQARLRKDCYVSIVKGPHKGRYGILMGAKSGRLEVCLRSEYKDDWELFDLPDLEYLENPPEKDWKTMTAKEAVESLMAKDPRNPTIVNLRKQGLLKEILYPERNEFSGESRRAYGGDRFGGGREGGRRVRSIAKSEAKPWEGKKADQQSWDRASSEERPSRRSQPMDESWDGSQTESKPWGRASDATPWSRSQRIDESWDGSQTESMPWGRASSDERTWGKSVSGDKPWSRSQSGEKPWSKVQSEGLSGKRPRDDDLPRGRASFDRSNLRASRPLIDSDVDDDDLDR